MKVLFVSSGNKEITVTPFINSQGESLKTNGIEVHYFLFTGKGILGYLRNIPKLRSEILHNRSDIVHAHYAYSALLALLTFTNIPVVVSFMGSDLYGIVDASGKSMLRGQINNFISKLIQPFVNQIIVKSKSLSKYIYLKHKMHIIPNGVDFNAYKPLEKDAARFKLGLTSTKKQILFLGKKDNARKNFPLLLNAFKFLDEEKYELLPFDYPTPKEEIPVYINASDVVVLTSYLEGSPNVVKESMACNIPVVSVDVGDTTEILCDTSGCYICEYDPLDLAEKIQLATNTKETTGRIDIERLEINKVALELIEIYKKCTKL